MKYIILILSVIALLISLVWACATEFDYEPLIVFIMGVAGILGHFMNEKNKKNKEEAKVMATGNNQEVNVNVNVGNSTNDANKDERGETETEISTIFRPSRESVLEELKRDINILFIDDDTKFQVVKILKDSGWKNTKSIVDIKSLDSPKVKDAHIYFVDINGVGKMLNCPDEGLDVALMLKQKYPMKKVVIYSADRKNNVFHDVWDVVDYKLVKNALPYQFQSLVEEYSIELKT